MFESESQTLKQYEQQILNPIREYWLHKDVVIPVGKFKGRKGRVYSVDYDSRAGICFFFEVYKYERRGSQTVVTKQVLWDPSDARTYWPANRWQEMQLWENENEYTKASSTNYGLDQHVHEAQPTKTESDS